MILFELAAAAFALTMMVGCAVTMKNNK